MEKYDIIKASDLYSKKEINSILYTLTKGISLDSFTVRSIGDRTVGYPTACCYGNGKFFVGTDQGEVFSFSFRTPGQEYTYSKVQLPSKVTVEDLAYGDGVLIVSMLRGSLFAKSTDNGESFTEFTVRTVNNNSYDDRGGAKICYAGDGLFIAACSVAGGGMEILHGVNYGETWYSYRYWVTDTSETTITDIAWGRKLRNGYDPVEGCVITVTTKNKYGTMSVPGNPLKQNITNYGNYGNYWKWTDAPVGGGNSLSVCYNNFLDKWVLVGYTKSADTPNVRYASMDAVVNGSLNWSSNTGFIGSGLDNSSRCIASTDSSYDINGVDAGRNWNLVIACSNSTKLYYSKDLTSWSTMSLTGLTTDCEITGIAYGDDKFFMCIDTSGIISGVTSFTIAYADFFIFS